MNLLYTLLKVLLLLLCAAATFGWGMCGVLGLSFSSYGGQIDRTIAFLTLGGFVLTGLFGWLSWKLLRSFFPSGRPRAETGDAP